MSDCDVCCVVSKRVHKCSKCNFVVCRVCARRVVSEYGDTSRGKHRTCLRCDKMLTYDDRKTLLGKTYVQNDFRRIQRERAFTRQTHLFAVTYPIAQAERHRRSLRAKLVQTTLSIREGRYDLVGERRRLLRELRAFYRASKMSITTGPCSYDACLGRVTQCGMCLLCHRTTCTQCARPCTAGHTCDPINVATVALVRRECRPCARCMAPSTRTEGCSVMWCVACHTFWNWDTGRIIEGSGPIPHNPDHRQWLQDQLDGAVREVDDIPCGGLPTPDELHVAFLRVFATCNCVASSIVDPILSAEGSVDYAQRLRTSFPQTWDEAQLTQKFRVSYLIGDIDTDTFSRAVERVLRLAEYRKDVGAALTVFVLSAADILQKFCFHEESDCPTACLQVMWSLHALRDILNDALSRVAKDHDRRVPVLQKNWVWTVPIRSRLTTH